MTTNALRALTAPLIAEEVGLELQTKPRRSCARCDIAGRMREAIDEELERSGLG